MKQSHIYLKLQAADSRWLLFIDALDAIGLLWDLTFWRCPLQVETCKELRLEQNPWNLLGPLSFCDLTGVTLTVDSSNSEQVEFSDGFLTFDLIKLTCLHTYITSVPSPWKLFRSSPSKFLKFPQNLTHALTLNNFITIQFLHVYNCLKSHVRISL